jgi:hypothetical protein
LPIVRASGFRDVEDAAPEAENSIFLPKPYTRLALLESVEAAMTRAIAK